MNQHNLRAIGPGAKGLPAVLLAAVAWSVAGCAIYPAYPGPYGGAYTGAPGGYNYVSPPDVPAYVYGPPAYYGPPILGGIGVTLGGGHWHHWR